MKALYQVTPNLWQGSIFSLAEQWDEYKDKIDVVFVFTNEYPALPDDIETKVVYIPFDDNVLTGISNSDFSKIHNAIYNLIRLHDPIPRVAMTCRMGENRSGLGSMLWLLRMRQYKNIGPRTYNEALELLRSKVQPRSGSLEVFWNKAFQKTMRRVWTT